MKKNLIEHTLCMRLGTPLVRGGRKGLTGRQAGCEAEGPGKEREISMTEKTRPMTIDEYISNFPADTQTILEKVRQTIHEALPEATEAISYAIPAFNLHGRNVVFFAGWKHHISMYPLPAGDEAFQQAIAPYKRAKGSIQFPLDKPIPYDLVARIVTFLHEEAPARR